MTNITLDGLPAKTGTISDAGIIHYREGGVDKKMTISDFLTRISEEYSSDINIFLGAANKVAGRVALGIDRRVTVDNAAYTILNTDLVVAQIGTMSAARTFTLPVANTMEPGSKIIVIDESGTVTNTNKIIVSRSSTDTINGATSKEITSAYGFLILECDGLSKWTQLNQEKATTSSQGIIQIATNAEAQAYTDSSKAIVPSSLASALNQFAIFEDQKASGTSGGTPTTGARNTRVLNTTITNNITGCSLASNQITLPAGTYFIRGHGVAGAVFGHRLYLRNVSDSSDALGGINGQLHTSIQGNTPSFIEGVITITSSKVFELQHYIVANGSGSAGLGYAVTDGNVERYSRILIQKIG